MKNLIRENWYKLMIGSSMFIYSVGLFFTSCGGNGENQKDTYVYSKDSTMKSNNNKYLVLTRATGERIEIADKDLDRMTWSDAKEKVKELGDGWRLPTISDLDFINRELFKEGKINLRPRAYYWSSNPWIEGQGVSWTTSGREIRGTKDGMAYTRPVRDL